MLSKEEIEKIKAFNKLEDWLFDNFEIYEKVNLTRWR